MHIPAEILKDALERLVEIGSKSSLRYSVQLLSLASQNSKSMGHDKVTIDDVEKVDKLFMDIGEAAEHLRRYEEQMIILQNS